jgi:menaquinone-dependent protoporphyrinogen IX oxidase
MKSVIIYKSKTGFTKKYAEWIAEELSADLFEATDFTVEMFADYDRVVYGGGLYAVGINGVKLITKNMEQLKGKKVVVFGVGMSPPREDVFEDVKKSNFTAEQQEQIKFFYLRGGFDYSRLKSFDQVLMTLLKWKIKLKRELTPDDKGLLAVYDRPADFTDRGNLTEIIDYITT